MNSLIGLSFLLQMMADNPENAFAQLVDSLRAPFPAVFVGIVYVLRMLFARLKPRHRYRA